MNSLYQRRLIGILVAISIALALGGKESHQEREKMEPPVEQMRMKSICIGRVQMDVPESALVSYRDARLSGWNISAWVETNEKYLARISGEEEKLKLDKNERNGVSLEQIRNIKNEFIYGRIFVFNRIWLQTLSQGVKKERQAVSIRALLRAHDVTYSIYAKIRSDSHLQKLEKIISQLRWRNDDEIPTQPGFCFERGFLTEPLDADQSEFTAVFLGLKDHPDLAIALSTYAGVAQDKSLLQRDAENNIKQQYRSRFHVLREGPRALNGLPGEEVLERVDEPNGSVLHGFMWESLTKKDDVYRPLLTLELDTGRGQPGRPVNASFSDPEVLALWEKISASLRIRPVSEADTHKE